MVNNDARTESVIRQIMEGVDPRAAIDSVLDEKAGFHKEKRMRGGKAQVVNVKNTKRKVHKTLTPDQKKAIKKAHSAAANKKRAKSLKKGAALGLYKESVSFISEDDDENENENEVAGLAITCPACGNGSLEIFDDPEGEDTGEALLVCPDCGETFFICSTAEIDDEDKEDEEDDDKEDGDENKEEEPAGEEPIAEPAEEEEPQDEGKECGDGECEDPECGDPECGDPSPEEPQLYFND